MQQVTSTAPGVYLIHEEGEHPVEGVAVYKYAATGRWVCQECGELPCGHIRLAKKEEMYD